LPLKAKLRTRNLHKKLLKIRKALKLSQTQLLRLMGVDDEFDRQSVSAWESGKTEPPLPILLLYAKTVRVTTDTLIDDTRELPKVLPAKTKK
jgi:transcriptional regulator with XRE-family HTH domain